MGAVSWDQSFNLWDQTLSASVRIELNWRNPIWSPNCLLWGQLPTPSVRSVVSVVAACELKRTTHETGRGFPTQAFINNTLMTNNNMRARLKTESFKQASIKLRIIVKKAFSCFWAPWPMCNKCFPPVFACWFCVKLLLLREEKFWLIWRLSRVS